MASEFCAYHGGCSSLVCSEDELGAFATLIHGTAIVVVSCSSRQSEAAVGFGRAFCGHLPPCLSQRSYQADLFMVIMM